MDLAHYQGHAGYAVNHRPSHGYHPTSRCVNARAHAAAPDGHYLAATPNARQFDATCLPLLRHHPPNTTPSPYPPAASRTFSPVSSSLPFLSSLLLEKRENIYIYISPMSPFIFSLSFSHLLPCHVLRLFSGLKPFLNSVVCGLSLSLWAAAWLPTVFFPSSYSGPWTILLSCGCFLVCCLS